MNSIVSKIFTYGAAEIINRAVVFFYTAYLARTLSEEGMGLFGASQSFAYIFIMVVQLGLDTYGTREVAKNSNNGAHIVNKVLSIRLILSSICYIILTLIVLQFNRPFDEKMMYLFSGVSIFSFGLLLNWYYIGIERPKIIAYRMIFYALFNFIGIFYFVKTKNDYLITVVIISLSLLLNTILLIIHYLKTQSKISLYFDKNEFAKTLKISLPIGISFLIITLYHNIDILMINFIRENYQYETGVYYIGEKVFVLTLVPLAVIQQTFLPIFVKYAETTDWKLKIKQFQKILYFLSAIITSIIFTFSDYLITLYAGESNFSETAYLIKFFMVSAVLASITLSAVTPLLSVNKEKLILWGSSTALVANVLVNLLLIPEYGPTGAVIASLICELVSAAYYIFVLWKFANVSFNSYFFKFISIGIVACIIGFFAGNNTSELLGILTSLVFYTIFNFVFKLITIHEIKALLKR